MKAIKTLKFSFFLAALVTLFSSGAKGSTSITTLKSNWQYRWGDSPQSKSGRLLWLEEANDDSSWKPIDKPSDIPSHPGERNLWVKLHLENKSSNYSTVLVDRIEKIFEVYLDTNKVYSFGKFTSAKEIALPGFAWHLIRLPADASGKTLFFRIRSDTKFIGFYGKVIFGTGEDILTGIIKTSLSKIILGMIFVFLGLALFVLLLFTGKIKPFQGILIFMTANGIWTLANTKFTQVLLYFPKLIYYADHLALFASAAGFFMIVVEIIDQGHKKLFKRIYQFFIGYLLVVAVLDITGLSDNIDTVAPFLIILLIAAFVLIYFIFQNVRRGDSEAKIFLASIVFYALFALMDIINYFENVVFNPDTYEMRFAHYGGFAFLLSITWILVARYVKMNKQMLLAQVNERARIAQDLHDDVGPRLTEIKMVGESIKSIKNLTAEEQIKLDELSAAADEVVSTLSEIVWVLNPTNDTLEEFGCYLSQNAIDFLHRAGVKCRLDIPPVFPGKKISYEVRNNILMAVKESLNNIVKHAGASVVTITMSLEQNYFLVAIADDGMGFDINCTRKYGNGLKNMERRIKGIQGTFAIETKLNCGTTIKFEVPLETNKLFTQNGYLTRSI